MDFSFIRLLIYFCEAKLMYRLGLRRHPPMEDIITLCSQDTDVGKRAFEYLCANLRTIYSGYKSDKFRHVTFIPAKNASGVCLKNLEDVLIFSCHFNFILTSDALFSGIPG